MAAALSADQELAMKAFMESLGGRVVDRAVALRFLLARKFDAARAAELFRQHEDTRRREGLDVLEPRRDPLRTELATGKFTVLKTRDAMGAAIAVFTASKHNPTESTHQTTLQGLVYQLDAALQSVETQRAGLLFIYDMTHAKYSNFDYDLSQKIITMLKGGYPAKLKKVLIVTPPFWFDGPFRILRLFLRKKLRERVHTVSAAHLAAHVPRAALPAQLGGVLRVDHDAWLNQCWQSFESDDNTSQDSPLKSSYLYQNGNCVSDDDVGMTTDAVGRAAPPPPCSPTRPSPDMRLSAEGDAPRDRSPTSHSNDGNTGMLNGNNGKVKVIHHVEDEDLDLISNSGRSTSMSCSEEGERGALSSEEDMCTGQGPGLAPEELLSRVRSLGRQGLVAEYDDIRSKPPNGTFIHSKLPHNLAKNRYSDVLCYDHSRVVLTPSPDDPTSDYINANFVDGYKQKNAFICTQGPLPKTYVDFWQMVWEQQSLVIVMTTKGVERGRVKCGQYWPANIGQTITHGHFQVTTENFKANQDYIVSDLLLTNLQTSRSRTVSHWQYVRWPDYGVPGRAKPVLQFLSGVRTVQANATRKLGDSWTGHSRGPPIIVHCSAGIGRTGTFLTLDISTCRLEECGVVDVRGCVERVRSQRAHSIQMPEQYVFCHLALIEYALVHGYLQHADWDGFVEEDDDHGP